MSYFEPIYKLRVSEKEKYKDEGKWFRDYLDYIVPYDTTVVSNYKQMKLWYDVINDRIDGFRDALKEFCRVSIPNELSQEIDIDEEIVHYNRIFSKYSYLNGEMLKRRDNYHASFISQEAIRKFNEELAEEIKKSVMERMLLKFEQTKMAMAGASQIEANDYVQEMQSMPDPEQIAQDFKSSLEIFANQVLEYFNHTEEVVRKMSLGWKHAITSDREICYVGEHYGKPGLTVINPLHFGFQKSPDEYRIEKGDYAWTRVALTMAEVINLYGDQLTQKQIESLGTYTYSSSLAVNERHNTINGSNPKVTYDPTSIEMGLHLQDTQHKTVGQAQGSGTNRRYNNERLIFKTHFEFKAFRELVFLSYPNKYGELQTEVHPRGLEIPEDATKVNYTNRYGRKATKYEWVEEDVPYMAEIIWIPRRYEVTRLGQDVYLNYREVPNQPLNLDDPYGSFELSYKGRIYTSVNSESISLVGRAIPTQFQYNLIKHIQSKEISKYEGFIKNIDLDQIPDYLNQDENGESLGLDKMAIWRYYRRVLGDSYYSGSQNSMGLPNPTRTTAVRPEVAGAMGEIINMQQLLELLDREIGMAMLVPMQAEGQFSANSNASDNQRALQQGFTMIEWYMIEHSELWRTISQEYLGQFRRYYQSFFEENDNTAEISLHYITPDNTKQVLSVVPDMLEFGDIGLFLTSNQADDDYRQMMLSQAQAIAQNAGDGVETLSTLLRAITSKKAPSEVHKLIQIAAREQSERAKEMERLRGENAARLQAAKRQQIEDEQSHEIDKIILQNQFKTDADEIPKELEATKVLRELAQKDRKLDIEQQSVSQTNSSKS